MMKALQVKAPGVAEFVKVPKPTCEPGHALIRPQRLSLCGSDVFMWRYADPDSYPFPVGTTGHEMIGVIEEINGTHPTLNVGDLTLTLAPTHQAMAEYYHSPLEYVLPIPSGVPLEHLLQAQQLGTVMYACKELPGLIGKDVVVLGQGSAGLWFNFMLHRLGARRVIGIDVQGHRLQHASHFGASGTIHNKGKTTAAVEAELDQLLDGRRPHVVVEAAGEAAALNLGIELLQDDGFILQFGLPKAAEQTLNYGRFFRKRLTLKGIVYATREADHTSTLAALEMIANGEIDVSPILTHTFPFERVVEALELQATKDEGAVKIVIEMP